MALINCPECNKQISTKAVSCPHCGYFLSTKKKKNTWSIFWFILIFGGIIIVTYELKTLKDINSSDTNRKKNNTEVIDEWYKGGTLHQATVKEWKNAPESNKLATCADFMAEIDNTVSMKELKDRATILMTCINKAVDDVNTIDDMEVATIAASCVILMGYK